MRTQTTGGGVLGLSSVGSDRTGAASTAAGSHSHSHSHRKHHHHNRSKSAPRASEKPPRKRHLNPGHSLASIPNQIKLSMLNSGLISFGESTRSPSPSSLLNELLRPACLSPLRCRLNSGQYRWLKRRLTFIWRENGYWFSKYLRFFPFAIMCRRYKYILTAYTNKATKFT